MKTFTIFTAIILISLSGYSQNFCATSFKVNNGNGTCPEGQLRLSFPNECPSFMPFIDSVYTNGVKRDVTFTNPDNSKCGGINGYIAYCVTSGNMPPADAWTIYFHNSNGAAFYCDVVSSTVTNTLPVKLVSFDATLVGGSVNCKWTTENEVNHNYFELERSFDGNNFVTAAIIFGAENATSVKNTYSFADKSPSIQNKNIIYYRIKQVDNNSKYTYSYIVAVKQGATFVQSLQVSPNPFVESLAIKFESVEAGNGAINIQGISGQVIATKSVSVNKGSNSVQMSNLSGLSKGIYIMQLSINGLAVSTQKIIKN